MIFHAKLPLGLWVDAFLIVLCLINRLPSTVLKMECPLFMLSKQYLEYKSLRIFGFRCFPYLRDYKKNKLSPKTYPCVFIGYISLHKGYRCLHPSTKRFYISHQVIFNENCFPYANSLVQKNHLQIPIEMVSFSTLYVWCETSKIDQQTKSWKKNTEGEKNKNKKYYNLQHHANQKTIFKWHDDLTLTWNIKEIKLKLQQELSNNLSNHNS